MNLVLVSNPVYSFDLDDDALMQFCPRGFSVFGVMGAVIETLCFND